MRRRFRCKVADKFEEISLLPDYDGLVPVLAQVPPALVAAGEDPVSDLYQKDC